MVRTAAPLKAGLLARPTSHNIDPRNCGEAVCILVAWAIRYRNDRKRKRSHIDFAPRLSARGAATGESSHQITSRRLRDLELLPRVSRRKLCELARIIPSHHDTGSDAGHASGGDGSARTGIQRA